jgi:hypothetical protein
MAKKFSLVPAPTFKAPVTIQVPGGKSVQVEFIFKHRSREDFKEFMDGLEGRKDVDILLDVASGWELEDAFEAKGLQQLVDNYMGAGQAVLQTYMIELTTGRAKN